MGIKAISWLLLVASIAAEVIGTIALRHTDGFTRPIPSLVAGISYAIAIWLMSLAVRHLEVGMAYAVWAGAGTALIALLGVICFHETLTVARGIGVFMIVIGVVMLNFESH